MNLLISGISGTMGKKIYELASKDDYWKEIDGIDANKSVSEIEFIPNVAIDFSHPTAIDQILNYCVDNSIPLVIGTTGFEVDKQEKINKASEKIAILQTSNMSLGMNLMFALVKEVASILKNKVDIEVIEAHHNRKVDAPSGSAISIIKSIEEGLGETRNHAHGRTGQCPREKGEIGVHAIRGGNIVGIHEAQFINDLESIKIIHEAYDRSVFAEGALQGAKFLINKTNGMYSMKDVLNLK